MGLPIAFGQKYAALILDAGTELNHPVELGAGRTALPRGFEEIPAHWREWLGTIKTDAIQGADLVLLATAPGMHPGQVTEENDLLALRAKHVYWGLMASGRLRIEGPVWVLTGGHHDEGIEVRRVEDLDGIIEPLSGLETERVTLAHLHRAATLGTNLGLLVGDPGLQRLARAAEAFLRGFSEHRIGERIHQFVRAVEGVTRSWGKVEFVKRCELLVGQLSVRACGELYVMRNNAEHLNAPGYRLPPMSDRRDLERAFERAHQAEALARYCMSRIVSSPGLWPLFSDYAVKDFWSLEPEEQSRLWGPPLDLEVALAEFDRTRIPNETGPLVS